MHPACWSISVTSHVPSGIIEPHKETRHDVVICSRELIRASPGTGLAIGTGEAPFSVLADEDSICEEQQLEIVLIPRRTADLLVSVPLTDVVL